MSRLANALRAGPFQRGVGGPRPQGYVSCHVWSVRARGPSAVATWVIMREGSVRINQAGLLESSHWEQPAGVHGQIFCSIWLTHEPEAIPANLDSRFTGSADFWKPQIPQL